jgi:N-dimethylarginine dimethylaminohydrolase
LVAEGYCREKTLNPLAVPPRNVIESCFKRQNQAGDVVVDGNDNVILGEGLLAAYDFVRYTRNIVW